MPNMSSKPNPSNVPTMSLAGARQEMLKAVLHYYYQDNTSIENQKSEEEGSKEGAECNSTQPELFCRDRLNVYRQTVNPCEYSLYNPYAMAYASLEGSVMTALTATEARAKLYRLIKEAAENHQPILITGKETDAVLVSKEDWDSIQETLHLLSVPGMRESIREGMATPVEECDSELDW